MQIKTGLATILKNFRISLHPKMKIPLEIDQKAVILRTKGGIWLNLEKL